MCLPVAKLKHNHKAGNLVNKYLTIISEACRRVRECTYLAFAIFLLCKCAFMVVTNHKVRERIT